MLLAHLHQVLHLVLAVLAVVVLEVEVLGHQGVQPQHVQQVVYVVPIGSGLLVQLILLHSSDYCLAECLHQGVEGVVGVLSPFLVVVHLDCHNHMLFQQEVFKVLEGNALAETLPGSKVVLVLSVADGALQLGVVLSCQKQDLSDDLSLPFLVLPTSDLVEHRQQEDNLVPLIQQEKCVILDVLKLLIVVSKAFFNLVVIVQLPSLDVLIGFLDLAIEDVALEVILFDVFYHVYYVVDDLLLLLELTWVDYHQVLTQVQLTDVFAQTAVHC